MFKPFYTFIGLRYTQVRRKNNFISFMSLTSILGISLGVGVLITVLSVMNGFNKEIRTQMLSGTPHIHVGAIGKPLSNWSALQKKITSYSEVKGAAPYIINQGVLSSVSNGRLQGVLVKGIDHKEVNKVYPLAKYIKEGSLNDLKPGSFGLILGRSLAAHFNVTLGDKISLITPEASVTPAGMSPRIKRFTVVGISEIGDFYDDKQVFVNIEDAAKLYKIQGFVTGIQVKVQDELKAPMIAKKLYRLLGEEYWVMDWTEEFGSLFRALQIQKTVMAFILLLIIAVAAFNLVSSLVMMVNDKKSDIAILRTLGANRSNIMSIFIAQGCIIGFVGTLLGALLGIYLGYNVTDFADNIQRTFNIDLVSKDVYLIGGFLPSEVRFSDVFVISLTAFLMCILATLYPAWQAANIQPAEALRYE